MQQTEYDGLPFCCWARTLTEGCPGLHPSSSLLAQTNSLLALSPPTQHIPFMLLILTNLWRSAHHAEVEVHQIS